MAKHETKPDELSTSEKNGGPRHDTGHVGTHRAEDKVAGSDIPHRDGRSAEHTGK